MATFLESPCTYLKRRFVLVFNFQEQSWQTLLSGMKMLKSFASMSLAVPFSAWLICLLVNWLIKFVNYSQNLTFSSYIIYATNKLLNPLRTILSFFKPKLSVFLITTTKDRVNSAIFWGMPVFVKAASYEIHDQLYPNILVDNRWVPISKDMQMISLWRSIVFILAIIPIVLSTFT